MRTDGRTDMTNLIVGFRNITKAPKIARTILEVNLDTMTTCWPERLHEVELRKRTPINREVEGWEKENVEFDGNVTGICVLAWKN